MSARLRLAALCLIAGLLAVVPLRSADSPDATLDRQFQATIRPFLTMYCLGCHGTSAPAAQFDMRPYSSMEAVIADLGHWRLMSERLRAGQMPPASLPQPSAALRARVIDWVQAVRTNEARKNAGDPGPVLARRLSNAEYDNTIRDLTGVDIRPAREFPVDPANPAGFDNSGESLAMSPALLNKYLQAAREVSRSHGAHARRNRLRAASDAGRDGSREVCDPADRGFLPRQPTDYADYFQAAWRYKHRAALGQARRHACRHRGRSEGEREVSADGLADSRGAGRAAKPEVGPVAKLQAMWRALPAPRRTSRRCCARNASRCAISWSGSAATRRCSLPRRW